MLCGDISTERRTGASLYVLREYMMTYLQHLMKRMECLYYPVCKTEWLDTQGEILSVCLTDFSGKINGYQRYNWNSDKTKRNDEKGKYYTYRDKGSVSVFGLQYFQNNSEYVAVTEGIFDTITALHVMDSFAVLSNNPKKYKQQISLLDRPTVALCHNDKAGRMLAKCCDTAVFFGDEDPNDLGAERLSKILKQEGIIKNEYKIYRV